MALYRAKEIKAAYGGTQPDPNAPWGGYYADSVNKTHGSNAWIYRSFLWYDLSGIPYKSTITSAKLYVFCNYHNDNAANAKHNFSRVTETWEEETLTWNNMPSVNSRLYCDEWQSAPTLNSWNNWDITPLIQEWVDQTFPNYGLQVVNQSESVYRYDWFFYNRRHSSEYATYIEIEYEPSEEVKITKARLTNIANALREKTGYTEQMSPQGIEDTINYRLALQEKTINPTNEPRIITPDTGYYGLSKVTVGAGSNTGVTVVPTALVDVGVSGVYTRYSPWSVVAEIDGSQLQVCGLGANSSSEYTYASTARLSYINFDILVEPNHMYRFDFETATEDIIVCAEFYPTATMNKIRAGQNISESDRLSTGWNASQVSGWVYDPSSVSYETMRFTFSYSQNAVPFVGGEVTHVTIYKSTI